MKGLISVIAVIVLIVISMLCLKPLDFYTTLRGMQSAAASEPGSFVWQNSQTNLLVLAWQQGQGYAFVVLNGAGDVVKDMKGFCNGNNCDWRSFAQFGKWLEANGYQSMTSAAIPTAISLTLKSYSLLLVALDRVPMPTFFMVPLAPSNFELYPTGSPQ